MRSRMLAALLLVLLYGALPAYAELAETDWLDLLPPEDLQALEQMPDIEHWGAETEGRFGEVDGLRQQPGLPEVMYSTRTVAALDGRQIRLGGYPVPLQHDAAGRVVELFLVPYPGACIHVPPPPPNQIVLVHYAPGLAIEDIYQPLWVEGRLRIESSSNALADAAYSLQASQLRLVEEDDL